MHWLPWLLVGYFLTWLLIPWILLQNKPPVSTLAWIWAVVLFPYLGALAFFLLGSDRLARKHLEKRSKRDVGIGSQREATESAATQALLDQLDDSERELCGLLSQINLHPMSSVEDSSLLIDAQQFYPPLRQRIEEAQHHVHVEFFIYRDDQYGLELLDAMIAAARRGVEVRLLADPMGCRGVKTKSFQPLIDAGGKFAWFRTANPLRNRWVFNLRNHRKIQIIDGRIAFVGGMNVGKEYAGEDSKYGGWRDAQLEVVGECAAIMQQSFANDWFYATDEELTAEVYYPSPTNPGRSLAQVMADGPDVHEDPIQMTIVAMLTAARERAWLTAGYFVPNEPLLTALKLAGSRGVDVRLLISEKSDHPYLVQVGRSYYEELLQYGVRIFEYKHGKGINHAKVAAFDDLWTMVGSANFDIRSMRLNFELNVLLRDRERTADLLHVLKDDFDKDSLEISLEDFKRRPFRQRAAESFFRPLAPLL